MNRPRLPDELYARFARETAEAIEQFNTRRSEQMRFALRDPVWIAARPHLKQMFANKCAYCESRVDRVSHGDIEHFRPKSGAMGLDKRVDPDHYFWLAYQWDNMLLACSICNSNKRTSFPVEGERAILGGDVATERPLLLDPCVDNPDEHLLFHEDGQVEPLSHRGAVTIRILGLDRPALVESRKSVLARLKLELRVSSEEAVLISTQPNSEYAGAIRQFLLGYDRRLWARSLPSPLAVPEPSKSATPLAAPTHAPTHAGYLKSIRLHHFRGVDDTFIPIADPREGRPSWLMLLGENAAGKSSVLQAVALALLGEKQLAKLDVDLDDLITNGKRSATIELETHADPPRIELQLKRGKKFEYAAGGEGYPGLVLGYGATRLSAREVTKKKSGKSTDEKRILNLFDPRAELTPAQRWMRGLDETNFNAVATTLKDLLRLDDEDEFRIAGTRVKLSSGETLDQLSSGYRAILALGVDMMQASAEHVTQKNLISGVVLLDEIDAHLHPRWKMDVVRILREAFPYVQFIASTHEPLCLRGLKDGEIVLMRRDDDDRVVAEMPLKSVEGLRVDQILTSPLFGLHTTLDPELDAKFRAYYDLLARRPEERTAEEEARLETLRAEVSRYGVLGYTRRDQMVYDIIDEFLATGGNGEVSAETKQRVLNIWRRVDLWGQRDDPRPS